MEGKTQIYYPIQPVLIPAGTYSKFATISAVHLGARKIDEYEKRWSMEGHGGGGFENTLVTGPVARSRPSTRKLTTHVRGHYEGKRFPEQRPQQQV